MHGRPRRFAAPLLAAVLAATAAGCGESAAKRKQKFVAEAKSICSHFATAQNQVQVPSVNPLAAGTSHTARAEWGLAIKQIAYQGTQEVKALGKLKPPKDLKERFEQLLAAKTAAFDYLLKGADAAKRNHVSEIKAPIDAGRKALGRATTQARALGLKPCE